MAERVTTTIFIVRPIGINLIFSFFSSGATVAGKQHDAIQEFVVSENSRTSSCKSESHHNLPSRLQKQGEKKESLKLKSTDCRKVRFEGNCQHDNDLSTGGETSYGSAAKKY